MKKKWISIFAAMIMISLLMPVAVFAEEESVPSPAISIGAGNIEKGNMVYMGLQNINNGLYPISWIVLGDANSEVLKRGSERVFPGDARLLITEYIQDKVQFDPKGQSNVWQGSNVQKWCNDVFLNGPGHFTGLEKDAMLAASKTDAEYNHCGTSNLDNERMFLLSAEEADRNYRSSYFDLKACNHDGDQEEWWLRSPGALENSAANVSSDGSLWFNKANINSVIRRCGVRPAFNLDLNSVLFTSAAGMEKPSGETGSMKAIPEVRTNTWKMTLLDPSRSFTASLSEGAVLTQNEGYSSWSVPVNYSGANTGNNEHVSAILADSKGKALYYGIIAKNSSEGSNREVTIPAGLTAGNYILHIFSEQWGNDYSSDYASGFNTIYLKVNALPPSGYPPALISIDGAKVTLSATSFTYNGKDRKPDIKAIGGKKLTEGTDYEAEWPKAPSKEVGTYTVTITGKGAYFGTARASYQIKKAANSLKIKGRTALVKYKRLKKKTQILPVTKAIRFTSKGQGKKTYVLLSAKKGKKNCKKYFRINGKTGKIKISKKLQKGTYKLKVKVKAGGSHNYGPSVKKAVFKIKIQ